MFSKICSVAVMLDYFVADSGTPHFAVVWFWTTKFFQTSLRIRDLKDRQWKQRVRTVRQSASWVPFSVIKFWKLKAFSVSSELCTLRLWPPFAMQVIIHPDWPVLNWQPMRAVLACRENQNKSLPLNPPLRKTIWKVTLWFWLKA